MKQELEEQLYTKYPKIFQDKNKSCQETCMCWGISCDDGWYWLLDNLCSQLQYNTDNNNHTYIPATRKDKIKNYIRLLITDLLRKLTFIKYKYKKPILKYLRSIEINKIKVESGRYPQIIAAQVKEKFGGLRFYINGGTNEQYDTISFAESLSYNICENCGSTKNVTTEGKGWIKSLCKKCKDK